MQIRELESVKDIHEIVHLSTIVWNQHYPGIISQAQIDYMLASFHSEKAIAEQTQQGYSYFLLFNEGESLGYMGFRLDPQELFLSKFYLLQQQRGKGYGSKAMAYVEGVTLAQGLPQIGLVVNKRNFLAIKVYEKLGFIKDHPLVTDIGQGFVMDDYKMVKTLP